MGFAVTRNLIATSDAPLIVGLGCTGLSCARFFHRLGKPFTVVDSRDNPPGLAALRRECPEAELVLGDIPQARLQQAGQLIVSPGVAISHPAIAAALEQGVPVCGDIDLFVAQAQAPVVGISASNGKSTVTELFGRMARRAGIAVAVGGNLGPPALDLLSDDRELYVLELSSFQLERAGDLGLEVACLLNLSPDHMDRHSTMLEYHTAKQRIFRACKSLVYNRDEALTRPLQADTVSNWSFGFGEPDFHGFGLRQRAGEEWLYYAFEPLMPVAEVALVGRHNVANALAALALGQALKLPLAAMLEELREFRGLPHRSQTVADIAGVRYINDSKATNPAATCAALAGFATDHKLILIAGGQGKGADFTELCEKIPASCKAVVLLGEDAGSLEQLLAGSLPTLRAVSMQDAVGQAAEFANPGDTVLLSPACASFDMFSGFAERGERFITAVQQLLEGRAISD
jgi:UDP-N-acetylmuramoylalanine--D-glutamate ligase